MSEVELHSPAGDISYRDSADHFTNGLLRLLNLSPEDFDRWLAFSEQARGPLLDRLAAGWAALRPPPAASEAPATEGRLLHAAMAESPDFGVATTDDGTFGWLVRLDDDRYVRVNDPPVYEEEYFEGDKLDAGGYGDYSEQAPWRLEKAHRQVREMRALTGLDAGRVLDIGSGYGYFRVALAEAGFDHDGLEVSAFARAVAEKDYGQQTFDGTLEDHWRDWPERYDAMTMFDLIEHVADPLELLRQATSCLRPGGVLGVKTPNLDCPEADVFGPHYHSLKREHLVFLTGDSLTALAAQAGLEPVDVGSLSHLLVGFVGEQQTGAWAAEGRGADLSAWYRRAR